MRVINCRSLIGPCIWDFINCPSYFFSQQHQVCARFFFLLFRVFMKNSVKLSSQSPMVITEAHIVGENLLKAFYKQPSPQRIFSGDKGGSASCFIYRFFFMWSVRAFFLILVACGTRTQYPFWFCLLAV